MTLRDPARAAGGVDVASLQRLASKLRAKPSADDATRETREPLDVVMPARAISLELVGGRGHYERVIAAIRDAHTSVWIATANVKELMIEDGRAAPGRRRTLHRTSYVSVLAILDDLAARGVELRLLHAEIPSAPFREELARHPRLVAGGLALRRCPRVHMKLVVVDGALLYLGSANWTGAGLGAKGSGRRNFELGIVTDDAPLLDQVQSLYERVWRGAACAACKLRAVCPGPLDELAPARPASEPPVKSARPKSGPRVKSARPKSGPRVKSARPKSGRPPPERPASARPPPERPASARPPPERPASARPPSERPASARPASSRSRTGLPKPARPASGRPSSRPVRAG